MCLVGKPDPGDPEGSRKLSGLIQGGADVNLQKILTAAASTAKSSKYHPLSLPYALYISHCENTRTQFDNVSIKLNEVEQGIMKALEDERGLNSSHAKADDDDGKEGDNISGNSITGDESWGTKFKRVFGCCQILGWPNISLFLSSRNEQGQSSDTDSSYLGLTKLSRKLHEASRDASELTLRRQFQDEFANTLHNQLEGNELEDNEIRAAMSPDYRWTRSHQLDIDAMPARTESLRNLVSHNLLIFTG